MTGSKRHSRNYSDSSLTVTDLFGIFFWRPVLLDASSHQLNPDSEVSRSIELVDQAFVLFFQCSAISTKTLAPKV